MRIYFQAAIRDRSKVSVSYNFITSGVLFSNLYLLPSLTLKKLGHNEFYWIFSASKDINLHPKGFYFWRKKKETCLQFTALSINNVHKFPPLTFATHAMCCQKKKSLCFLFSFWYFFPLLFWKVSFSFYFRSLLCSIHFNKCVFKILGWRLWFYLVIETLHVKVKSTFRISSLLWCNDGLKGRPRY